MLFDVDIRNTKFVLGFYSNLGIALSMALWYGFL